MSVPREATLTLREPHQGQLLVKRALMGADGVVVRCGRRWGKTVFGEDTACEVATGLLLPRDASGNLRYGRVGWFAPNTDYSLPVWESLKAKLEPLASRISAQDQAIWLHGSPHNEPNIELWTCHNNDHPGRSRDYDLVVFDESGLIDALDTIWEQAVEPTLAITRGKALMLGTPLGRRTPFNVRFDRAKSGTLPRWHAFQRPSTDNPLITPAYVAEKRRQAESDGPRALAAHMQEYHGEPMDDGSNPIGLAHIARAVAPRSENPVVCWGVDLASSIDFTVVIGLDAFGRWAFCARWQEDWPATKARVKRILRGHECPMQDNAMAYVDKTGVGSPIVADLQLELDTVVGKTFTPQYRRQIIQRLCVSIPQSRFTIPGDEFPFLRAELESLGAEERANGVHYSVPDGMHDDGIMALALAAHAFEGADVPVHDPIVTKFDVDHRSRLKVRRTPEPHAHDWQTTPQWGHSDETVEL